ncbi:hypothetical protein BT96DRAFT_798416, partial [Gymnopus androsaceus JB14]
LCFNWMGKPTTPPDMALQASSSSNILSMYASWSGNTRTAHWELPEASDSSSSDALSLYNQSCTGFKTTITYNTKVKSYNYY